MTAQSTATVVATRRAGAASREEVDWNAIDWQKATETVRRLQARLVKATQDGRWGKAKALQRLLTRSFSGKALAVRRVTENRGKNTPGVDGATWPTPEQKAAAIDALRPRGYRPRPLRRVYIPKKNGKLRPLGIPTMTDRAMQALYLLALDPIAETTADPNSYGFRPARSAADALAQCFIALGKPVSPRWVLEGDITSCFDRISHDWLLAHVPMDRAILRKWLKAGYMEQAVVYETATGTPQGGVISPVLANLALDGLEAVLRRAFPKKGRRHRGPQITDQVNLIRYADDFIITGRSQALLEHEVKPLVEAFLRERGLELSPEKTVVTHIDDGFDFLGQTVRKYRGKLLITPSKDGVKAHLAAVRGIIKANKQATAGQLIVKLNPVIRGWATYHRHAVSSDAFNSVDHATFTCLWRWATRRHRGKGARWVKDKYFARMGNRNWVFTGEDEDRDGKRRTRRLARASDVPIRRHVKVQGDANPYDPTWEAYFERRLGVTMAASLVGRRRLIALWKRQQGICPRCRQRITAVTGWHVHHLIWRSRGGSGKAANLELMHPTCHWQLHTQTRDETVGEPRPTRPLREA